MYDRYIILINRRSMLKRLTIVEIFDRKFGVFTISLSHAKLTYYLIIRHMLDTGRNILVEDEYI